MWLVLVILVFAFIFYLSSKNKKSNIQERMTNTRYQPNIATNQNKYVATGKFNFSKQVFNEFVVLDFETTGLNPSIDKIVEIAALKYKNGVLIGKFYTLVNPQVHIPTEVVRIHGIDDKMVKDSPTIKERLPELLSFIGELPIVAHNAKFDINFLNANMYYLNKNIDNPIIDTLKISREIFSELPNHKLQTIKEHFGMSLGSHRALDDTKVTAEIYLRYCKLKLKKYEDLKNTFTDEELECYKLVKDTLVKNNKDIKYLRYTHTGSYFDVNAFANIFRIKLKGRKQYIVSKHSIDELKAFNPELNYEPCVKSETGTTRIIINNFRDLAKFEDLIIKSYDDAIREMNYYVENVGCGKENLDEYLASNLK